MFSPILTFFVASLVAVDVIEEVAVPVGKATVEYTLEAVDWTKEKFMEETE